MTHKNGKFGWLQSAEKCTCLYIIFETISEPRFSISNIRAGMHSCHDRLKA